MKTIFLDNKEYIIEKKQTILELADKAGLNIPSLCHSPITRCGGKCMVCAVYDLESKNFVPACVTEAQHGMKLDLSSEKVKEFRKTAVELLLSEHRGDCEAPCKIVCPQNLNIPAFIAMIKDKKKKAEFKFNPEICKECQGRCEKACRRGRLDKPVEIRKQLNLYAQPDSKIKKIKPALVNQYQHFFGRITLKDMHSLYLVNLPKSDENDSLRCLQCDCLAANDCKLREIATLLNAQQSRFARSEASVMPVIREKNILYDRAKCIRCSRCVELGMQLNPGKGPVMIGRGMNSQIDAPVGMSFGEAFAGNEKRFVDECPTGALALPITSFNKEKLA